MSDLKHKTPDELRAEIASIKRYRDKLEREWKYKEEQAKALLEEVNRMRSKYHGQGQREAWARLYLAQKT